jgi:hypothetical protein
MPQPRGGIAYSLAQKTADVAPARGSNLIGVGVEGERQEGEFGPVEDRAHPITGSDAVNRAKERCPPSERKRA